MADLNELKGGFAFIKAVKDAIENPAQFDVAAKALVDAVALTDAEVAKRDEYNNLAASIATAKQAIIDGNAKLAAAQTKYDTDKERLDSDIAELNTDKEKFANDKSDLKKAQDKLLDDQKILKQKSDAMDDREGAVKEREDKVTEREIAVTKREDRIAETIGSINTAAAPDVAA
jgi:peptidoglycan hydrolase CwlO-like protein